MASSSFPSASPGDRRHLPHSRHDGSGGGGTPGPPPPTPSNPKLSPTHAAAADAAISHALRHLTSPALSLPPRPSRFSSAAAGSPQQRHAATPPVISLAQPPEALLRSAASEFGFFHLVDHGVPSHLPAAAQIECRPLLQTQPRDLSLLGFDGDDGGGEDVPPFLVFDVAGGAEQGLPPATREYARRLEKVGMEVVEMLARAGGFRDPFFRAKASAAAPRSLVWIASTANGGEEYADHRGEGAGDGDGVGDDGAAGPPPCAPCYPYAVCLQYQTRSWRRCLLLGDDASWTTLAPHAGAILVAVGDIAQVWSDGGFKKVRGIPAPAGGGEGGCCATVSVLVTLSTDSVVAPALPPAGEGEGLEEEGRRRAKFSAFAFEEYAWRRFHEQFPLADPLRRYRL